MHEVAARALVLSIVAATWSCATSAAAQVKPGAVFTGKATYYGGRFHGKKTANGELFDMHKLTAAHRTLPFGTEVEVTNLKNGKEVTVRINDRGPWGDKRRIIDVSQAAAMKLGMLRDGVVNVRLRLVRVPERAPPRRRPQ